jgi:L-alanine-DL-glutamate epimerase-like enolase superfamily enzyme
MSLSKIPPYLKNCCGLTEAWRIAWMAYEHNIQWVPHGSSTAIGQSLTPSPYFDELVSTPLHLDAAVFFTDPGGSGLELS